MRSAIVYLSSVCPVCQCEFKMPYTRLEITELLLSEQPFFLYSSCHNISWQASEDDRRQLFSLIKPADVLFTTRSPHKNAADDSKRVVSVSGDLQRSRKVT